MSLAAIQDNLVKSSLVQQTQTRGEDVARGQEIAQAQAQREKNRQEDEVVISTRQAEQEGIRADAERRKDERRKKRKQEEEEEEKKQAEAHASPQSENPAETGTRVVMRRINIVI